MRTLSDAAEITMKFLEGNQSMEAVRVLGRIFLKNLQILKKKHYAII